MTQAERNKLRNKKLWRTFAYELRYWWLKTQPLNIIKTIIYIICVIIVSYSDTHNFVTGPESPLPKHWLTRANEYHFAAITIVVILILTIIELINDRRKRNELLETMNDYIPAVLKKELDKLLIQLVRSHGLSRGARATIFVPGRFGLFQWRLQMACRSSVVSPAEQLALFQLDEGAIGYTFLKTKRRRVEVVPITNIEADKKYNDLSYENKAVIKKNITCILVVSVFHDGQIAGLVAIDSNNINDNIKMEEQDVHNVLFDWLTKRERDIRLLWRLKNNV